MKEEKPVWHNVKGATPEELKNAEASVIQKYGDILDLPHHVSEVHPPQSMEMRAAQFSPFAALEGYEDLVQETARMVAEENDLGGLTYSDDI